MRHILAFIWKHNFFFLFLVLEVVAIYMIANKSYYQRAVLSNATDGFTGTVLSSWSGVTSYFSLKQENERLAAENALLHHQLTQSQLSNLDTTLHLVADTAEVKQYTYTLARVISNSTNRRDNYIMLNKGRRQGIARDMAVMNPEGVVGTVTSVSENYSWVMSVLNKHTRMSGRINRINQMGTVVWKGGDPTRGTLLDIPAHVKINKGDTITTSGFSHIFPEGIMIGTVQDISVESGDHFYTIHFRYSADLNSLRMVYLVNNLYRDEQIELSKNMIDE